MKTKVKYGSSQICQPKDLLIFSKPIKQSKQNMTPFSDPSLKFDGPSLKSGAQSLKVQNGCHLVKNSSKNHQNFKSCDFCHFLCNLFQANLNQIEQKIITTSDSTSPNLVISSRFFFFFFFLIFVKLTHIAFKSRRHQCEKSCHVTPVKITFSPCLTCKSNVSEMWAEKPSQTRHFIWCC